MKEFLKVSEVADWLQVSTRTVYAEIECGKMPHVKIGKPGSRRPIIRIPVSGLREYASGQKAKI